jgi:hypothetical protein
LHEKDEKPGLIAWMMQMVEESFQKHTHASGLSPQMARALKEYKNPRGLPSAWLEAYLSREPAQLAIDLMHAFDENYQLKQRLARVQDKLKLAGIALAAEGAVIGWLATELFSRLK